MTARGSRFFADLARDHVAHVVHGRVADVVGPYARAAVETRQAAHRVVDAVQGARALHAYSRRGRSFAADSRPVSGSRSAAADSRPVSGSSGEAPLYVAGELFHGPDERKRALAALATDFAALQNDLAISATGPGDADWVRLVVVPILADWHTFMTGVNKTDLAVFTLEWSAVAEWHERLTRLRELARTRGIALVSPDPVDLPKTIWERGGSGTGSVADTTLSFLKVSVYGIIAITGFVGFFSIVKTWRDRSSAHNAVAQER